MTRRANGFTLFEVLVAAALMSMVLMGISATFQSVVKVYSDVRAERTDAEHARLTLALLADDFRSLEPKGGLSTTSRPSQGRSTSLFQMQAVSEPIDETFLATFVSGVPLEQHSIEPELSLVRVMYSLRRYQNDSSWTLVRTERRHPFVTGDFPEESVRLVENVKSCTIRFETQTGLWKSDWNVAAYYTEAGSRRPTDTMPRTVQIALVLKHSTGKETPYELYIALPF